MADLALYTAQPNAAGFDIRTKKFSQRFQFHRIAHTGTGAVCFQQPNGFGRIVQLFKRFFHRQLLAFGVRRGNAFSFSVGRSTHSANNGINAVAVFNGVGQAFQNNHTSAFGHYKAVSTGIKRIGTRVGQSPNFAEFDIGRGRHHLIYTACNGHVKVTHAQPVDGLVNGSQRGGTGRVHREVGAVQVKHIGYAAGDYIGQFARHGIFGNRGKFFPHAGVHFVQHFLCIGRSQRFKGRGIFKNLVNKRTVQPGVGHFVFHTAHRVADNDRSAVMVKLFFIITGIFQRHARGFNSQVLNSVHLLGNLRRNAVF